MPQPVVRKTWNPWNDGELGQARASPDKKNPTSAVCNSSFELLLETGGTIRGAFDVQLRPVGDIHSLSPVIYQLRFKDIALITSIGREIFKIKNSERFQRAIAFSSADSPRRAIQLFAVSASTSPGSRKSYSRTELFSLKPY